MSSVVFGVLLGLLVLIVVLAILIIIGFYIFHRRSLERQKREEEQFLKDEDTIRMQQGAVPEAPEITISEWQSKSSARLIGKYGSTGDESLDGRPKSKAPQQKALSTKNSDPILDSVSLKSRQLASPPTDVTEEPTKLSDTGDYIDQPTETMAANPEHSSAKSDDDQTRGKTSTAAKTKKAGEASVSKTDDPSGMKTAEDAPSGAKSADASETKATEPTKPETGEPAVRTTSPQTGDLGKESTSMKTGEEEHSKTKSETAVLVSESPSQKSGSSENRENQSNGNSKDDSQLEVTDAEENLSEKEKNETKSSKKENDASLPGPGSEKKS